MKHNDIFGGYSFSDDMDSLLDRDDERIYEQRVTRKLINEELEDPIEFREWFDQERTSGR